MIICKKDAIDIIYDKSYLCVVYNSIIDRNQNRVCKPLFLDKEDNLILCLVSDIDNIHFFSGESVWIRLENFIKKL